MAYKILVIEDEVFIRETIVELLTNEQFEVISASDGKQGIELAIREAPHLIICDRAMPDLTGYQVLEKLRTISQTRAIPFIFLTSRSSDQDKREIGSDDYLLKPFTKDDLIGTVRSSLQKQTFFLAQLNSCYEEVRNLKQENHQLENRQHLEEKIINSLVEDLRGNFSKLNLAVQLLKKETNEDKRTRYLEILEQELTWEIQLLNKVSHLQRLMKSEDINFLQRYKLLEKNNEARDSSQNASFQ
ncbi:MAG: response regulator [Cyanobacteria bacterium]|jgi:DNA-binding response OmpR family regulator|nr:response regulator [Cyanobacteria bacterium GSL.Bin21]